MALLGLGMNPYQAPSTGVPGLGMNPYPAEPEPYQGGYDLPAGYGSPAPAPPPPPDPYAQWGGQAKYDALRSGFATQKQNVYGSANDAAGATGEKLNRSILDFLDSAKVGQQGIDNKGVNNEMAKSQGVRGIMGMVGRGIRSSGVQLANKNAGDSSAAGALANAYGQIGRGQLSNVGNQYEMAGRDLQQQQDQFNVQQQSGVRAIQGSKNDAVNNIVLGARDAFAQLDAQIANASLPDRIAIEQEKEAIRQQVLGKLQQYDQQLTGGLAAITPTSLEARRTQATELADRGQAPEEAFQYTDEMPGQWQGTGPFASELPVFTYGRGRRTA